MTQPKRTGPVQDKFLELVRGTRDSRHYCNNVIWGNLQTEDYARPSSGEWSTSMGSPTTSKRGPLGVRRALSSSGRMAALITHCSASRPCARIWGGTEVMRGQLTHPLNALALPGLKLGVIPARAELALYLGHSFTIFDGRHVHVETFSARLDVKDEREVAVYKKAFALLERSAVYGQEARELIEAELTVLT
ncbi:Scr1 family TA system antitoxin-like transcriptional regulator [Streptomyces sp. NPDC050263]|uniref:Scr1 family TA system antitoxin-like transcriptional regulator n=1 Tax=Streptomyces sp. NPDC050263 TaxID=3155037 RepID=UPI00342E59D0